jgi:hypothetical protein
METSAKISSGDETFRTNSVSNMSNKITPYFSHSLYSRSNVTSKAACGGIVELIALLQTFGEHCADTA